MMRIGDILTRYKEAEVVQDDVIYKQVTIGTNYKGVRLRGTKTGIDIGTKNQWLVKAGQFILSRIDARNSAFGIIPENLEGALVTNDFLAYVINEDEVDREFFNVFLQSPQFLEACIKASRGNTNRKRVQENFFLAYEVNLPPIKEQKKLIQKIQRAKAAVAITEEEITHQKNLLTKLKQAILQEAIEGNLTADWRANNPGVEPVSELLKRIQAEKAQLIADKKIRKEKPIPEITPEETPFEIPESWEWCRFGDAMTEVSYGTSQKAHSEPIGIPVLRMGNITTDGEILYSNLKYVAPTIKDLPKLYLSNGDIVFNRTNSLELVGKSAVFRSSEPYTLASYLIRARSIKDLTTEFLVFFLNSSICRTFFIEPNVIQQNGQANFNGTKLKNIPMPLPPMVEQIAIIKKVKALMLTCQKLQAEIDSSHTHSTSLLQAVLKEAFSSKT